MHNQILNEIRSQEDTAKQLTSVNAILIGGYLAVLMNSQSLGAIRDILIYLPFTKLLAYAPVIPLTLWFISIFFCLSKVNSRTEQIYTHIGDISTENLINILKENRKWLNWGGYFLTILGLFFILIIMIYITFYNLVGLSQMWNDKGITLLNVGEYEESLAAFDKAIDLNPNYAEAWYNKGRAFFELNKRDDSCQAFDKALSINPHHADAWYNKGIILAEMQEYDNAFNAFDNAIEINYRHSMAWNGKGVVLFMMSEYNKSIDSFNTAIKYNPRCAEAWNNKGIVLLMDDKYNESIKFFEKACELNPDYYYANINKMNSDITYLQAGEQFNAYACPHYTSLYIEYPSRFCFELLESTQPGCIGSACSSI